jgi:hypothetical protein
MFAPFQSHHVRVCGWVHGRQLLVLRSPGGVCDPAGDESLLVLAFIPFRLSFHS